MTTPQINPVDEVLATIAVAVEEWKAENSPESIKKKVKDLLDKESKQLTLKLLGFNDSWGKWELDHCNGRSGNSPAGDYLQKVQKEAIQEWFTQLTLPKITPALQKKLASDMESEFITNVTRQAKQKANGLMESSLKTILDAVVPSNTIENYLKLQQLINPTSE